MSVGAPPASPPSGRLDRARRRAHPRHLVLFALAAGLGARAGLAGGHAVRGAVGAAVVGRRGLRPSRPAAVLGGAAFADARLAALDAGSPARDARPAAGRGAAVRARAGRASTARTPPRACASTASASRRWPGCACRARPPGRRGRRDRRPLVTPGRRWARWSSSPAGSRRWAVRRVPGAARGARGAGGRPAAADRRVAGRGAPGRSTRVRRRAEAGLARGLPAKEAALLRGMVLGQDERLSEAVRTDFQRSGLAHSARGVAARTSSCSRCSRSRRGWSRGLGLRARLAAALALVAVYVPLAGGGPSIQRAGRDGRRRARRGAGGAARVALVRARARGGGDARAQPARRRASRAGSSRSRPSSACSRSCRAGARRCGAPGCPAPVADAAAVTAAATVATAPLMALPLRAGLARLAAGQPRRRARGRAGDVARDGGDRASRRSRPRCARR